MIKTVLMTKKIREWIDELEAEVYPDSKKTHIYKYFVENRNVPHFKYISDFKPNIISLVLFIGKT